MKDWRQNWIHQEWTALKRNGKWTKKKHEMQKLFFPANHWKGKGKEKA